MADQRQEHARRIHQINRRNVIFDGDVLGADHLLRGHGEKRSSFYGGVVGDDHHQTGLDARQSRDYSGRGCAAPLFIHAVRGKGAELEKSSGIGQQVDPLARRQSPLVVLALNSFRSPALANLFFLVAHLRNQVSQKAHVGFETRRRRVHMRLEDGGTRGSEGVDAVVHKKGNLKPTTV